MATIPTYRDLEDRIEVLEGKLRYWSNLARLEPDEPWGEGDFDSMKQGMKEAIEWDDERMDIIGQNGNDGLHYNTDKEGM